MEVEPINELMSKYKDNKNVIGQFLLGKTLGEGTFGKVKIGTHIITGEKVKFNLNFSKQVAVKILEKIRILDESDKVRVDREIKILKSLMHHNIIQIYSVIENPTTIFLIMEYSSGGELYDYIVLKKRLSDFEACKYLHQIINGVEYIHKVGVVHRDLKPENLLLDHKNNIKIVDFGLSNIYKNGLNFRTPCGSPCYAAPEMILGKVYNGTQIDIWSIGVILYAMLCGFLPFDDPDNDILYKKIIDGNYSIPNFLSDSAKDLLKNILNTDPEKRYTLKQIRSHAWFNRIPVMINEGLLVGVINIPVDENILEKMKKLGYPKDEVRENLLNNRHNNATTTYYLMIRNQYRNGVSSVSDLVSIEFLRHIRNPYNLKLGDTRGNGLVDSNVTYTNLLENKSNFDSNLCIENEIELNEQEYLNNDPTPPVEKQPNISRLNSVCINNGDLKITVYETNFLTDTAIKDIRNQYATTTQKTNTKYPNIPPIAHARKDSASKYSETTRARPNSAKSPMKNVFRSTSANQSNQKKVKNTTQRKANKFNLPIKPTGPKNIKKKMEEQYEKYVKNTDSNRNPNKFKKGFLNTSAIFEKNTEIRSQSIADKYKSENNKYGSNARGRNISVSKRVGENSPSTIDLKKSPINNRRVTLNSRP
jgi:serine/threonine protein kinase